MRAPGFSKSMSLEPLDQYSGFRARALPSVKQNTLMPTTKPALLQTAIKATLRPCLQGRQHTLLRDYLKVHRTCENGLLLG